MRFSVFYFALFLSRVRCERPIKVQIADQHQCTVHVSGDAIKTFNEKLDGGNKVIYFKIRYDSKQADALTQIKPNDHFVDPNEYMWLFDGENGLPVYMNAPYDFELLSLFILRQYTSTLTVNMNVSKSCNESIVKRLEFIRLMFHQLTKIVSTAKLPDKKALAYVCYDINNRKDLPDYSFMAYKRLGINRQILLRYCCKVKDINESYEGPINLCKGVQISSSKTLDLQNYIGAFLFAFFPLAIGFISKARLIWYYSKFAYIRSVSGNFHKGEQFALPFGTESCWISEHDDSYSIFTFLKWLFLFNRPSLLASRIRRSSAVFLSISPLVFDTIVEYFSYENKLKIYAENNIPLGYKSIMFGYKKSAENCAYSFGGPYVWFSAFLVLGLVVINIPDRFCQTIAYSTLHQRETCTFLVQDIKLLQRYGSLNMSNLHDYQLLHDILKSSLLTALNPSFWRQVINRWFERCKSVYCCFNSSYAVYQLIGVFVTFLCILVSFFLCIFELLLCIVYYGCPQLLIWKAIPHSYSLCYICPLVRHKKLRILGVMLFLLSLPVYLFLFIFSTYLFLTIFQLLCSYVMYTVIALIAKPDAIAYVLLTLVFFYYVVSIIKSVSETYLSLLKVSIKLADSVCKDFVYTRLEETFLYAELFEQIVERHHPVRYEVAKALTKLLLVLMVFISCVYSFENISLNLSTYIKIGLIILTSMIPKITTVLKDTVLEPRWKIERILETIYAYKLTIFDIQDYQ